jgi:hypothetical protein
MRNSGPEFYWNFYFPEFGITYKVESPAIYLKSGILKLKEVELKYISVLLFEILKNRIYQSPKNSKEPF